MIDGVKFSVYGAAKDNLRQNPLLKFSEATYDGLRLRITPDACYVRGSLHRFKNRGEHNADDFTLSDFGNTLIRLSSELEINPEILVFSNVEFGLNVPLPFAIDEFLQSIILYRGEKTAGVVREPHGIRIEFTEYIVKAYDKTKVLPKHTEKDTLRFEIDITRTRRIRNQLMDDNTTVVRTLSDLAQPAVWRCFGNELVRAFDALVICDDSASASELQRINEIPCRMKKKRELDKFIQLSENSTMKKEVRKLICDKINDVTNSPKNASNSPFFVTNSPFFEDVEFEEFTENDVTISHVDKGGFCNTPSSSFSKEIEVEKKEDLKRICPGNEEWHKEKKEDGEVQGEEVPAMKSVSELLEYVKQFAREKEQVERQKYMKTYKYLVSYLDGVEFLDGLYYDGVLEYLNNDNRLRIYQLCYIKGIDVEQLSIKMGLPYKYLAKVAKCKKNAGKPNLCRLQSIADALEVPLIELFKNLNDT